MFRIPHRTLAAAVAVTAASVSVAQTAPAAPAGSSLPATDLGYRSAFDSYQKFKDEQVGSWKSANDEVGRIGGWREYAKDARQPEASATTNGKAPAAAPAATGNGDPHAGHGQKR